LARIASGSDILQSDILDISSGGQVGFPLSDGPDNLLLGIGTDFTGTVLVTGQVKPAWLYLSYDQSTFFDTTLSSFLYELDNIVSLSDDLVSDVEYRVYELVTRTSLYNKPIALRERGQESSSYFGRMIGTTYLGDVESIQSQTSYNGLWVSPTDHLESEVSQSSSSLIEEFTIGILLPPIKYSALNQTRGITNMALYDPCLIWTGNRTDDYMHIGYELLLWAHIVELQDFYGDISQIPSVPMVSDRTQTTEDYIPELHSYPSSDLFAHIETEQETYYEVSDGLQSILRGIQFTTNNLKIFLEIGMNLNAVSEQPTIFECSAVYAAIIDSYSNTGSYFRFITYDRLYWNEERAYQYTAINTMHMGLVGFLNTVDAVASQDTDLNILFAVDMPEWIVWEYTSSEMDISSGILVDLYSHNFTNVEMRVPANADPIYSSHYNTTEEEIVLKEHSGLISNSENISSSLIHLNHQIGIVPMHASGVTSSSQRLRTSKIGYVDSPTIIVYDVNNNN
jgi:hypothetical protein